MNCYIMYHEEQDQFSLVPQLCLTLSDPMDCSTPGFPVHHQLLELTQTHVHRGGDACWGHNSKQGRHFSQSSVCVVHMQMTSDLKILAWYRRAPPQTRLEE